MIFAVLNVHLGVFLCVHHGRNGDTEVGDGVPEVWKVEWSAIVSAATPCKISSVPLRQGWI